MTIKYKKKYYYKNNTIKNKIKNYYSTMSDPNGIKVPFAGVDCTNPANKNDSLCQTSNSNFSTFTIVAIVLGFILFLAICIFLYIKFMRPQTHIINLPPLNVV